MPDRTPMSPAEFDARTRRFAEHFAGEIHQTSGTRSTKGNADAGGNAQSKHLYGMAKDYKLTTANVDRNNAMVRYATRLGFWTKAYAWGIHLQGLPTGPIPRWWWLKYGAGKAAGRLSMDHEAERVSV